MFSTSLARQHQSHVSRKREFLPSREGALPGGNKSLRFLQRFPRNSYSKPQFSSPGPDPFLAYFSGIFTPISPIAFVGAGQPLLPSVRPCPDSDMAAPPSQGQPAAPDPAGGLDHLWCQQVANLRILRKKFQKGSSIDMVILLFCFAAIRRKSTAESNCMVTDWADTAALPQLDTVLGGIPCLLVPRLWPSGPDRRTTCRQLPLP